MSDSQTTSVEAVSEGVANPEQSSVETQETKTEPTTDVASSEVVKTEGKTEETKPEAPKDRFGAKFAALSRKEKAIRAKEREIETRQAQAKADFEARMKALEEREARWARMEELKNKRPLEAIKELGLSYDDLTAAALNDQGELPPERQTEATIAELKAQLDALKKEREEEKTAAQKAKEEEELKQAEARYAQQIDNFKGEIKSHLDTAGEEKYELMKSGLFADVADPVEAVYDVILEHYRETQANSPDGVGEIMDITQAADLLEQWLEKEAEKLAKTKKAKSKLLPPQAVETKAEKKPIEAPSEPKTLENAHSSTVPNRQGEKLSDDELLAQAASLIRWNKTQ